MRMNRVVVRSVATLALAAAGTAHAQTLNDLYPELATLIAADGASSDNLGTSVAIDGDTLVVGSSTDDVGANADQGSARVFVRSGSTWTLQATLTASDGAAGDFFGSTVAISGDSIAVGAPGDDVGANSSQGSVRTFSRSGAVWTAGATLTPGDGAAADNFGSALAYEYNTLVVGMRDDDVGANVGQGSVRVYTRNGGTWTAVALFAFDGAAGDAFGASVSISGDSIAVGAPYDGVNGTANQGSAKVFVRIGGSWLQQQSVVAADGAGGDGFGFSVSISGNTLAVGASADDVGANTDQGSVRIFTRDGTFWSERATLVPAVSSSFGYFGVSIALADDVLIAGSVTSNSGIPPVNTGSAWVFVRNGTTWQERVRLLASDGEASDYFGDAVAIDGTTIAVGAPYDDVNGVGNQGSVRIFGSYRVFNDTTSIGYSSLASAIAGSSAGARLLCGAPAFAEATGIVDASQKRFTYVALEPLVLAESALMTVATNTVFEKSPNVVAGGLTIAGDLSAPQAGTLTFEQLSVASGGQLLQRGSTILVNQNLATTSGGVCYLQGPILAEAVTTAVGAQNRCAGDTDIFANYTNAGATIVQRGILYIYGTLVNTGTLTGEVDTSFMPPAPGDGYSIGGDYALSADSSLVLPDPVWWLRVGGDLDIAINSPTRFVMDQATIELTGVGDAPSQTLEVFARDYGAVDEGFANSNYLLGALRIRAGATVELVDNHNNATGKGQEAIYTNDLFVPAGATLVTNGYRIYTRAATIAGTVSDPADVIVVPGTPPCAADLFPDGVVSAADLSILLERWGPCSGACIADIDGDGNVGAADLSLLLVSWGPCAN
ncbi:MAG: hypothetical protein LW806_05490 [Planctomycetaceae bacterium]|nr:hypothetical protein [Planctomycetaceae bacterium]